MLDIIRESDEYTPEDIISKMKAKSNYLVIVCNEPYDGEPILDLSRKTIEVTYVNVFDFEEVKVDEKFCEFEKVNGKWYIKYEDGKLYDVTHIEYDDLDLLSKHKFTYEEFDKLADFFMNLQKNTFKTEFILNNEKAVVLNCI